MISKYRHRYNPPSSTAPSRKRTHLNPSQVAVLQESFVTNPLPDAAIRGRLARELGVTERTIQIWFQNRRAKARKIDALGGGNSGSFGRVPQLLPSVRTGWIDVTQATQTRFQTTFRSTVTPEHYADYPQEHDSLKLKPPLKQECMLLLPIHSLRAGSWTRFAQCLINQDGALPEHYNLSCYCTQNQIIWQIQDAGHHFRISIDHGKIQQMHLIQQGSQDELHVYKDGEPTFSMWRSGIDSDWIRCGDFSEDKQATLQSLFIITADRENLRQALLPVFAQCPDLIAKFATPPPALDFRDLSISPSATPEPHLLDSSLFTTDIKPLQNDLWTFDWSNSYMFQTQPAFL